MERIVVDLQTGEQRVVSLTPEEIAEIEAAAAAAASVQPVVVQPTLADLQAQLAAIQAQINEIAGATL